MSKEDLKTYQFGPFSLEAPERLLLRNGRTVPLTTKLFDILLFLVQNSGHLLSKEILMERIWPDSCVEENNLTVNMSALRRALREGDDGVRYIETVPGHGYRFVARVQIVDAVERDEISEALPRVASTSIAVLLFRVLGTTSEEYLGLGMTDALIAKLGSIKQIAVTPISTILRYAQQEPLTVGRRLGVESVLHGCIQKEGGHIRVTVQFIYTHHEKLLWADRFDEQLTNVFTVQDSIAEKTAQALRLNLTSTEKETLARYSTESPEAFEAYQKGRYFWNKRSEESIKKGIHYFQQAIGIDANYALAFVGIADCYNLLTTYGAISPAESISRIKTLIRRALEIDNTLAEAHATLGYIRLFHDWDWPGAEKEFQQAIELNPNYAIAHQWHAMCLMVAGRFPQALEEMRRALTLDPLSPIINASLAGYYYYARQYEQAIRQCLETLDIDPNSHIALGILGVVYAQVGRYEEATRELEKALRISRDTDARAQLGYINALWGHRDKAKQLLRGLKGVSKQKPGISFGIALVHIGMGEFDLAFEWLEKAYHDHDQWLIWLPVDPRLDPLRSDPRFAMLVRRIGLESESSAPTDRHDSLAVLPLINGSGDPDLEYLSYGISEGIINNLSQLSLLKVTAFSTVCRYKSQKIDPLKVGRELNVGALLAGRLFKLEDDLFIGIELINTRDGSQLWGEQQQFKLSHVFAVQEEVAREISKKLQIELTRAEREKLTERHTENAEAYQLYLRGHYFRSRYTIEHLWKSIECFQQAIALDQNYALAYAGLSNAYFRLSNTYLPPGEAMPKARAAAAQAIEIDDHLAEGHMAMGMVQLYFEHAWAEAQKELRRAVELSPGSSRMRRRYGWFLVLTRRVEEGFAELNVAQRLNPLSFKTSLALAAYHHLAGQYELAVTYYSRILELDPHYYPAHMSLGWTYLHMGKLKEAFEELSKAFQQGKDNLALAFMGYGYALSGRKQRAKKLLAQLIETSRREYVSAYNMAIVCSGLGEKDQAFRWLEKLCEERNEWLTWLNISPELENLRSDPRFKALLLRTGLPSLQS